MKIQKDKISKKAKHQKNINICLKFSNLTTSLGSESIIVWDWKTLLEINYVSCLVF